MKISILYHPNSEYARSVEEYAHDFENQKGVAIDLKSLETKEGAYLATLYGIVQYPALLVLRDNNDLIKNWEGVPLPIMNEVAGYFI